VKEGSGDITQLKQQKSMSFCLMLTTMPRLSSYATLTPEQLRSDENVRRLHNNSSKLQNVFVHIRV